MDTDKKLAIAQRITKLADERAQRKQSVADNLKAIAKLDEELTHLIGELGVPVEVKP